MKTYEIHHRLGIATTPKKLFAALTETKLLESWWSEGAEGESVVGGVIQFRFGDFKQPLTVTALEPAKLLRWRGGAEGIPQWAGTEIEFRIEPDKENNQILLYLHHSGFREPDVMFCKCSTKWVSHLLSLKELLETGKGSPFPNEIACDHD